MIRITGLILAIALALPAHAAAPAPFKKALIVVLENTDYDEAVKLPFLSQLAKNGALLSNFHAETHPSQPNYIALVAGDTFGIWNDFNVDLAERHLGDLLEAQGKSWKVYAEGYPGDCYLGGSEGSYARKHVPFLSFENVQQNPERCARIVEASQLQKDLARDGLPDFALYIPDLNNDGHDTGAKFADKWLARAFGPLLKDARFTQDLLFVVTFDEGEEDPTNRIFTAIYGPGVKPGSVSDTEYNHYSLLRTIEDALGLGTLGRNDDSASHITGIWK